MIERIAILGTGLLGTSVGLALRAAGFGGSIVGWNRSPDGAHEALSMRAIDAIASILLRRTREPGRRVVRAHLCHARLHGAARSVLGPEHLVTDVGSTKVQITAAAGRLYNSRSAQDFFPAIPWQAKNGAAPSSATPTSSVARCGCLPTIHRGSDRRRCGPGSSWREWVAAMGSKTIDLDAARHDELVAWVSHLPQFTATAFSSLLEDEVGDAPELKHVGGRALREMTRLGASPFSMWRDIAHTNTAAIEAALAGPRAAPRAYPRKPAHSRVAR